MAVREGRLYPDRLQVGTISSTVESREQSWSVDTQTTGNLSHADSHPSSLHQFTELA